MAEFQLRNLLQACMAEFVAMTLFVVIGCGSAMGIDGTRNGADTSSLPGWVLMVALAFGLSITVLAYATGHHGGGHINCAVTMGLVLAGECAFAQGVANFLAQMLGSIAGASILCLIYPAAMDHTGGLGSNGLADGWQWHNALIGEIVGTCLLMYVVLQTACHSKSVGNRAQAALAIGLAVFMAHMVLIPIDGCSINPTRSFGPALIAQIRYGNSFFKDMWIFWVGPIAGSFLAAAAYRIERRFLRKDSDASQEKDSAAKPKEVPAIPRLLGHLGSKALEAQVAKVPQAAAEVPEDVA